MLYKIDGPRCCLEAAIVEQKSSDVAKVSTALGSKQMQHSEVHGKGEQ
jgi:hypothetical protein